MAVLPAEIECSSFWRLLDIAFESKPTVLLTDQIKVSLPHAHSSCWVPMWMEGFYSVNNNFS